MQRIAFLLLGLLAIDPIAVSATKVVQCKTTYRGKLEEPGQATSRSSCSLFTNNQENMDMCVTTDTRGDNTGYFSDADDNPTLCVTLIYSEKDDSDGIENIVLYRGLSQLTGVSNCSDVCKTLNKLMEVIGIVKIHYIGCDAAENSNNEYVDQINYLSPTNYTCKTHDNYAKPGDSGRPGPPAPIPSRPTSPRPSTTATTRKPTPLAPSQTTNTGATTTGAEPPSGPTSNSNDVSSTPSDSDSTVPADSTPETSPGGFFEAADFAVEAVDNVAKVMQKIQTREEAQSTNSSPSWTWPILGSLIGLLVLMVISLVVELVIARMIFKEITNKVGVAEEVPMS